jgi:hypothetical protein
MMNPKMMTELTRRIINGEATTTLRQTTKDEKDDDDKEEKKKDKVCAELSLFFSLSLSPSLPPLSPSLSLSLVPSHTYAHHPFPPPRSPCQDDEDTEGVPQGPLLPDSDDIMDLLVSDTDKGTSKGWGGFGAKMDKLDLSGLLNVLDGVVDTPNRILVMTTNHPEKLDPALIRPGRIDKKLFLGYMRSQDAADMLQHYFKDQKVTEQHRATLHDLLEVHELNLTPAQVEQLCAENDTIADMIAALKAKAHPPPSNRGISRAASIAMQ